MKCHRELSVKSNYQNVFGLQAMILLIHIQLCEAQSKQHAEVCLPIVQLVHLLDLINCQSQVLYTTYTTTEL